LTTLKKLLDNLNSGKSYKEQKLDALKELNTNRFRRNNATFPPSSILPYSQTSILANNQS
jgi:hypothetical protein